MIDQYLKNAAKLRKNTRVVGLLFLVIAPGAYVLATQVRIYSNETTINSRIVLRSPGLTAMDMIPSPKHFPNIAKREFIIFANSEPDVLQNL